MSRRTADTLRILAADMVQKANSGHPGLPMGMADCAAVLWTEYLVHDPEHPEWPGRDRFVLSGGHGSALLYSLLHLSGYDMSMEELQSFRQWGSRTPGHPECHIEGVETTTGPLGQGLANAVGMALAGRLSAARWNTEEYPLFGKHYVYCFCGDGDMMEGLSHETASLAGHLGLGKLICFYDSNRITIDGSTDLTFSDDTVKRFEAYHWHVQEIDGHDQEAVREALNNAREESRRPSMIITRTDIAFGSPNKAGTAAAHGAPLGEEELKMTKKALGFPEDKYFYIPPEVKESFSAYGKTLRKKYREWNSLFGRWKKAYPEQHKAYSEQGGKQFPEALEATLMQNLSGNENSTRAHSGNILQQLAKYVPGLIGGSSDLAASDKTALKAASAVSRDDFSGRNIHYGVREFSMGAVMNGIALYGSGFIPFGGTFLVFSDYMRSAIRLAAIMRRQVVFVFSHDSIFVGEDGPTHQPVEQLMSLRLIPNLQVIRPADEQETAKAWLQAIRYRQGPTALILTRQKCPEPYRGERKGFAYFDRGAYTVTDSGNPPELILAASGSELSLCLEAAGSLKQDGLDVRVISVPSLETFLRQDREYRDEVIPPGDAKVVCVEAGSTLGWGQLTRNPALFIGVEGFGRSAPSTVLAEKFGFTPETLVHKIKNWLAKDGK
ncbi:MAG: transketolase [Candidatus Marinimicrobia bacterium]|nr:transketolase [Candidatus Neomarinimicrobiota bacterium]